MPDGIGPSDLNHDRRLGSLLEELQQAYADAGLPEQFAPIETRLRLPQLAGDYAVAEDATHDLAQLLRGEKGETKRQFAEHVLGEVRNWARGRRDVLHEREIGRLHTAMMEQGGRLLYLVDRELEVYVHAMQQGKKLVEGASILHSEVWGDIDLEKLNGGLANYKGGLGEIALARDLAITTGRLGINLQQLQPVAKSLKLGRDQNWKQLPIEWRRGARILSQENAWKDWKGRAGYVRFATEYTDGDLLKAYIIASAIMDKEFGKLGWGKGLKLKVVELEKVEEALKGGIYQGREGYVRFAKEYVDGDLKKAYQIASAILDKEFGKLAWGKGLKLKVAKLEKVEEALKSGIYQGREGYVRFAKEYADGDLEKAYQIASAILDKEFGKLGWGKGLKLKVAKLEKVEEALKSGTYHGRAGYVQFAKEYADGDLLKAYQIASAILDKQEFDKLGWGKALQLKVTELEKVEEALKSGTYNGRAGYVQFAKEYVDGDLKKAYQIASAILDKEFGVLGWGKGLHLKVAELEKVEKALRSGTYQKREGYVRFAKEYADGDLLKAYMIASAILDKEFDKLGWGKGLQLKVVELEKVEKAMQALSEERYKGVEGFKEFKKDYFPGRSSKSVWSIVSALLGEDGSAQIRELGWPSSPEVRKWDAAEGRKHNVSGGRGFVLIPTLKDWQSALPSLMPHLVRGMGEVISGGAGYVWGDVSSDVLMGLATGDFGSLKHFSPLDLLKNYSGLAVGGGGGKLLVDGMGIKGLPGRSLPLFTAIIASQYFKQGKVDWESLPLSMTNVLVASGVVQGGFAIGSRVSWVRKAAIGLRLAKGASVVGAPESLGTTLLGTAALSTAEFLLLKTLGKAEQVYFLSRLKNEYEEAEKMDRQFVTRFSQGDDSIGIVGILEAEYRLMSSSGEYESYLKSEIALNENEFDEKLKEMTQDRSEALYGHPLPFDNGLSRAEMGNYWDRSERELRDEYHNKLQPLREALRQQQSRTETYIASRNELLIDKSIF